MIKVAHGILIVPVLTGGLCLLYAITQATPFSTICTTRSEFSYACKSKVIALYETKIQSTTRAPVFLPFPYTDSLLEEDTVAKALSRERSRVMVER